MPRGSMGQKTPNDVLNSTSFLDGANTLYIERLYAQYLDDPGSVDASWQPFFAELGDNQDAVKLEAEGPAWARTDWPPQINGEMVAVLDGNWPVLEEKIAPKIEARKAGSSVAEVRAAVLDSIRAIMMIRAYRMRGHLSANLDPLGIVKKNTMAQITWFALHCYCHETTNLLHFTLIE